MPFCTQCGNTVGGIDRYCARCGAQQPMPATPGLNWPSNFSPRTAAMLCYIPWIGWIPAIVILASERFRTSRDVRFHAFQGLYLFVAWLLVHEAIRPFFKRLDFPANMPGGLLELAILIAWLVMLIKTAQDQFLSLPLVGELAERSVSEQK